MTDKTAKMLVAFYTPKYSLFSFFLTMLWTLFTSWFGLNIFICHKQNKRIRHKLYYLGCRPRVVKLLNVCKCKHLLHIWLPILFV